MKTFLLVFSMWGYDGLDWQFIGNQYVYSKPMTEEQCSTIADQDSWFAYESNPFYKIAARCMPTDASQT
jgi:hypothetical protein|tara:strand:+ start:483 stop:689 length:207 start_codon:yes stop_codon:yes gene_type:complete